MSGYSDLVAKRAEAKAAGRLFGIGFGAGIEPSGSNMAYVTLAQTPEERERAGGRSGGTAVANVNIDPSGGVTVQLDSTPAGQGHNTVAAQIVADALGMRPDQIRVNSALDTGAGGWSLASGNYANRFASIVVGAITESADRIATKLRTVAADLLEGRGRGCGISGWAGSDRRRAGQRYEHRPGSRSHTLAPNRSTGRTHLAFMRPRSSIRMSWTRPTGRTGSLPPSHSVISAIWPQSKSIHIQEEYMSRRVCIGSRCRTHSQSHCRRRTDTRRVRSCDSAPPCSKSYPTIRTVISSPAPSPTISARLPAISRL